MTPDEAQPNEVCIQVHLKKIYGVYGDATRDQSKPREDPCYLENEALELEEGCAMASRDDHRSQLFHFEVGQKMPPLIQCIAANEGL